MFDTFEGLTELENAMNEFINLIKETSNVTEIKIEILNEKKSHCEII